MLETKPPFKDLYTRHVSSVRALLYRMGAKDDLDDLVQETFVKIHEALNDFDGRSSIKTWIFAIAMNEARALHRKNKRRSWLSFFDEVPDATHSNERPDVQISQRREIDKALTSLSPKLRETLVLSSLKELDLAEIAKVLDIPLGTVKSRLNEARSKIKFLSEEDEHG